MHDNAIARAMIRAGHDVLLQPVYTPIRTDESDVATNEVFFGGASVYLLQKLPGLAKLPRWSRSWLDHPKLLGWLTRRAASTNAADLGDLTISMLRGIHGNQGSEVQRLLDWLAKDIQPDAVVLSNLLIGGMLPALQDALPSTRRIVILQGDDIFLDHLSAEHRQEAIELCSNLSNSVDRFVVHSQFYRDKMASLLGLPLDKFTVHPLSIDTAPYRETAVKEWRESQQFHVGYMARIAPEKGFHLLVDAFEHLATQGRANAHMHAAGWLGENNREYFETHRRRIEASSWKDRFTHHGSPSLAEKAALLKRLDVLSVPTVYEEPKGLFVLEALASGVPVIQPDHGAFGELVSATGGGLLFQPGDSLALAEAIQQLQDNLEQRKTLALSGREAVLERHGIEQAAERLIQVCAE